MNRNCRIVTKILIRYSLSSVGGASPRVGGKLRNEMKLLGICVFLIGRLIAGDLAVPASQDILNQQRPESWPEWVDVKMDESILKDEALKKVFKESFSNAPSLQLDLSAEGLFGEGGVYPKKADPEKDPAEVSVKVTYWHPEKKGFEITCGLRAQGSGSLSQSSKRNFRLRFSKKFGKGSLKYPLFSEGKAQEFENLLIRNPTHDSWAVRWHGWRKNSRYVNDRWAMETSRSLGHLTPRQEWVHLFINRIYWGVYALSERPDEHFAALHRNSDPENFDVFNAAELREGSEERRKKAERFLAEEFENTPEAFEKLSQYVDLTALMDHLICQIYQGKSDWPRKNYFLVGDRTESPRFYFGPWDSEIGFYESTIEVGPKKQDALNYSPLSSPMFLSDSSGPGFWLKHLRASEEFCLMFADRVHELTGENGVLSPNRAGGLYRSLLDELNPLLLAEALRWGDSRRKVSHRPYGEEWEGLTGKSSWLFTKFFPLRPITLKQHFREEGLWPELDPPGFYFRNGSKGERKFYLRNPNIRGIIVFTQDGSDPREHWTGKPRGNAFREPINPAPGVQIKARILSHKKWSPMMSCQIQ